MTRWQYIGENDSIHHIGPVAQDFYDSFGLGDSEKHISTLDADGVALAAIQGLHEVVKEKDAEIETLRNESAMLRTRLQRLEAIVFNLYGPEHNPYTGQLSPSENCGVSRPGADE